MISADPHRSNRFLGPGAPTAAPAPNPKPEPKVRAGHHYTRDSSRRAVTRACEAAFPLPEPLARRDGETRKEWEARLTKLQKDQRKAWHRAHRWHPYQLRQNYATEVRKQFGLEAAQILLGHTKADVTPIYAERDLSRAAGVAQKIG